jgi:hypothetical protein
MQEQKITGKGNGTTKKQGLNIKGQIITITGKLKAGVMKDLETEMTDIQNITQNITGNTMEIVNITNIPIMEEFTNGSIVNRLYSGTIATTITIMEITFILTVVESGIAL